MTLRHRIAAATAALTLALGASGCGDGAGPPEIGRASSGPITRQRVEEFARAVNLRADDLPGARRLPSADPSERHPEAEAAAERCLTAAALPAFRDPVAVVTSPGFAYSSGDELANFASTVQASHTEEEMAAIVGALSSPRGFACFERLVTETLEEEETAGNTFLSLGFRRIHQPLPLGSPVLGARVHAPFEAGGVEHDAYLDFVLFTAGHAEITLTAVGMPQPVNQEVEARLVSTLIERAEHHAL